MTDSNGPTIALQEKAVAELTAMKGVVDALAGLDQVAVQRVLRWAAEQYGVAAPHNEIQHRSAAVDSVGSRSRASSTHSSIADLFAAAAPRTGSERALVAAYWFQVVSGQAELDAKTINAELKHLGYGLSNVTTTLSGLMSQRPQLVIQTRKFGRGSQARKRYKLTHEGIGAVEAMIGRPTEERQPEE